MKAVAQVNESLPPNGRVRKFILLHKEFDADEAEMTRTRKLRRGYLIKHYSEMIDGMYAEVEYLKVSATVSYQDGRESVIDTHVRIMTLEEAATS
jgi:long-chain acyl-CoA synthetase